MGRILTDLLSGEWMKKRRYPCHPCAIFKGWVVTSNPTQTRNAGLRQPALLQHFTH